MSSTTNVLKMRRAGSLPAKALVYVVDEASGDKDGKNLAIYAGDLVTGAPYQKGDRPIGTIGGAIDDAATKAANAAQKSELAAPTGAGEVGFQQPETGAIPQTAADAAKIIQVPEGYTSLQVAINAKRGLTSSTWLQAAQYAQSGILGLNAYLDISGIGDASQIKLAAGAGLAYQAAGAVFDDHPHKTLAGFRITGDGTFQSWPTPQNGTTTGFSNGSGGAHFLKTSGMTFELGAVGRSLTNNYTSFGAYNYFRANKIGARFDGVTSYVERDSYYRYNSDAAVYITGATQNLTLQGGAIEGNPGRGIWVAGLSAVTPFTLTLDNVYMEGNGDQTASIPAVDVELGVRALVRVLGGSYKQNVTSGRINGEYRWGSQVVIDGAAIGGRHFASRMALRGECEISDDASFNTMFTSATGIARGLVEPMMLTEFSVRSLGINPFGACFQAPMFGRAPRPSPTYANLATLAYPHIASKAASVTVTENTAAAYGDGSWSEIAFPATAGDFNNNWVTLQAFTDASSVNPYRVATFLLRPTADTDIGMISSGGAQNLAVFFRLLAGQTYRLPTLMARSGAGTTNLRLFSIQASPSPILFLPLSAYMVPTLQAFTGIVNGVLRGSL